MVVASRPLTRLGLCELVSRDPDMRLELETGSLSEACRLARLHGAGIVLVDLEGGLVRTESIAALAAAGRYVIVLAAHGGNAGDLLASGASGVLGSDRSPSQIIMAVRAVVEGQTVVSVDPEKKLGQDPAAPSEVRLTGRELQVLKELITGKKNSVIAEILGVSEATVKFHMRNLMAKFGAESRTEVAYRAGQSFCYQ